MERPAKGRLVVVPWWEWADYGISHTKAIPDANRTGDPERVAAIAALGWDELVAACEDPRAKPMSDEMFNRICTDIVVIVQRVQATRCSCPPNRSGRCLSCRLRALLDPPEGT